MIVPNYCLDSIWFWLIFVLSLYFAIYYLVILMQYVLYYVKWIFLVTIYKIYELWYYGSDNNIESY